MKHLLVIILALTNSYTITQELTTPLSPSEVLFLPDISQHITHHLPPNNLFLNYYQDQLALSHNIKSIMRNKYIAKNAALLWRIFKSTIAPITIQYQSQLPITSALNTDQTHLAIAYEDAVTIYAIETNEVMHTYICQAKPTALAYNMTDLFIGYADGTITRIDTAKNTSNSIQPAINTITHMSIDQSTLYTLDSQNHVSKIDSTTLNSQTHTISLDAVTAMHAHDSKLIFGLQSGAIQIYDWASNTLDESIQVDSSPVIAITPATNGTLYVETITATYSYTIAAHECDLVTQDSHIPSCSLPCTILKLFKQCDLISERFHHTQIMLPEIFYIGTLSLFILSPTICIIGDLQKIIVCNLAKILTPLSLKELQVICLLEDEYQSKYTIWTIIYYLSHCCVRKKEPRQILKQEKWAAIYASLPTLYKTIIQKRYKVDH